VRHQGYLSLAVDLHASSNAPLDLFLTRAHLHVQVGAGAQGLGAHEDGLGDLKLLQGLVDVVDLRRAVCSSFAVDLAAAVVAGIHGETLVVARAVGRRLALGAVHERDVVPELTGGDGVFELRVVASEEVLSLADLHGSTGTSVGLAVSGARRDADRCGHTVSGRDRPDPDVVAAAVGDDGVASKGKASLECRDGEGEFGKHVVN